MKLLLYTRYLPFKKIERWSAAKRNGREQFLLMLLHLSKTSALRGDENDNGQSDLEASVVQRSFERLRRNGAVPPDSLLSCMRGSGSKLAFPKAPDRPVGPSRKGGWCGVDVWQYPSFPYLAYSPTWLRRQKNEAVEKRREYLRRRAENRKYGRLTSRVNR